MGALVLTVLLAVATPAPALTVSANGGITVVSQSAAGPGTELPYSLNSADDPQTPYDFVTGTPGFTGTGVQARLHVHLRYAAHGLHFGLFAGTESDSGTGPNILYLGETAMPTNNPFESARVVRFNTYLGTGDEISLNRTSILSASAGASNGSWNVDGGWFLPKESLPFVFAPPPLPNSPPSIAPYLPELPGEAPSLAGWAQTWPALPLQGLDATARTGNVSAEFFDAALPTQYANSQFNAFARVRSLWVGVRGSGGSRLALQVVHANENTLGGYSPISADVMWGDDVETEVGPEGPQPSSDTFGQRTTILGVSAQIPISEHAEFHANAARSWFSAQYFSAPGRPTPGGYYDAGIASRQGRGFSLDLYRFDPTYAPQILPYGNALNLWPVAWSWPSNWLKQDYQLVANTDVSANRQGARVRYDGSAGRFSYNLAYARFAQVTPYNGITARLPGFTDPFFTASANSTTSYRGTQSQYEAQLAWRAPGLTASLDLADDVLRRAAPAANPAQAIDIRVPEELLTLSHAQKSAVFAVGAGRFGVAGCYALCGTANVAVTQWTYFAGANFAIAPRSSWLFEWRRYVTNGLPFADLRVPPAYTGTRLVLEERFTL